MNERRQKMNETPSPSKSQVVAPCISLDPIDSLDYLDSTFQGCQGVRASPGQTPAKLSYRDGGRRPRVLRETQGVLTGCSCICSRAGTALFDLVRRAGPLLHYQVLVFSVITRKRQEAQQIQAAAAAAAEAAAAAAEVAPEAGDSKRFHDSSNSSSSGSRSSSAA